MKKINLLICTFCCIFCMSVNAQKVPTYEQMCDIQGVKDCKAYFEGTDTVFYYFNFTQPLGKNFFTQQNDTSTFTTRVLAIIRDVEKPTLFFVSGYGLSIEPDTMLKYPNYYPNICADIIRQYDTNVVFMEHRFFGPGIKDPVTQLFITTPGLTSYPKDFLTKLDYLSTENAAADFHNVISALKQNILKGKTIMAGWSKGGMTTTLQSYYYPEDMDVFIPYSAPFCNGFEDPRMYNWINDSIQPGSSELRSKEKQFMDYMMKKDTANNYVYNEYRRLRTKWYKMQPEYQKKTELEVDTIVQVDYELSLFCNVRWDLWAYRDRSAIRRLINIDSLHTSTDVSELLVYYLWKYSARETAVVKGWKENIFKDKSNKFIKRRNPLTAQEWMTMGYDKSTSAYNYQSCIELGNYYIPLKEEYPQSMNAIYKIGIYSADSLQNIFRKNYTHSTYEKLFESVRNTKSKILFIYGGDDPWTGARIEDQYLGASNVKRFILPSQNHRVQILNAEYDLRESIFSEILDPWIFGPDPSGIEDVSLSTLNGQQSTAVYNLHGVRVNDNYKGIVIVGGKKILKR